MNAPRRRMLGCARDLFQTGGGADTGLVRLRNGASFRAGCGEPFALHGDIRSLDRTVRSVLRRAGQ